MSENNRSWYQKILGRSILSIIFGNFFQNKNNAAGLVAIILVGTFCYISVYMLHINKGLEPEYVNGILNIIFVVIGYYFGANKGSDTGDTDESEKNT